jgi:hypothetical protein
MCIGAVGCSKEESSKTEEQINKTISITGKFLPDYIPVGAGLVLDKPFEYDGKEFMEINFDDDKITNLLPRKYFTYYAESGTFLDEEYNGKIPVEISFEFDNLKYDSELNRLVCNDYKVISVDKKQDPTDQTDNEYPLKYHEAVFNMYCKQGNDGFVPSDVKDTYFYKNTNDPVVGDKYKKAVDYILSSGYFINMGEGDYYIEKEKKVYSDGEITTPIDYTLYVADFVKKYPPVDVKTEKDGGYYEYFTKLLYYDGLTVMVSHDDKDYIKGFIAGIEIKNGVYSIDDLKVGMSLSDANEYCKNNYKQFYNHHDDVYVQDKFVLPNGLALKLNDSNNGSIDSDKIEVIDVYQVED